MAVVSIARARVSAPGLPKGSTAAALMTQLINFRHSLLQNMREEAPVNKNPGAKNRGALRLSLRASPFVKTGSKYVSVFTANDYIFYVINATRPHRIEAKDGGVLAFEWNGGASGSARRIPISFLSAAGVPGQLRSRLTSRVQESPYPELRGGMMFLRFVNHPGTSGNDFVTRAVDRAKEFGTKGLTEGVSAAMAAELLELVAAA